MGDVDLANLERGAGLVLVALVTAVLTAGAVIGVGRSLIGGAHAHPAAPQPPAGR